MWALQVHPELLLDHDRLVHGVHDLRRLFLYWTQYGVTGSQIAEGLSFRLPKEFLIAFAAFGVIGVELRSDRLPLLVFGKRIRKIRGSG